MRASCASLPPVSEQDQGCAVGALFGANAAPCLLAAGQGWGHEQARVHSHHTSLIIASALRTPDPHSHLPTLPAALYAEENALGLSRGYKAEASVRRAADLESI